MRGPASHDHQPADSRLPQWWGLVWPKLKTPLQMIISQLIAWAIRKALGE